MPAHAGGGRNARGRRLSDGAGRQGRQSGRSPARGWEGARISAAGRATTCSAGGLRENLEEAGADCTFLRACAGRATGVAVIVVTEGNNRIILDAGANAAVTAEDARAFLAGAKEGDVFLAQAEVPFAALFRGAFRRGGEKGMLVLFNPAPAAAELKELARFSDIVLPNETELAILTGKTDVEEGAAALSACGAGRARYPRLEGLLLAAEGRAGEVFPLQKGKGGGYDRRRRYPSAAGLAVKLAEGAGMEEAIAFASRAAALSVTRRGAQASIPFRSELG